VVHYSTDIYRQEATVTWYGGIKKQIQYLSGVDLMYKSSHPVAKVRWVLVKDPEGMMQIVPLVSSNPIHTTLPSSLLKHL